MDARLDVDRTELIEALKLLRRLARTKHHEALMTYRDGLLSIYLAGHTVRARAEGTWPGQMRLPGGVVTELARALPAGDPVRIEVDGSRLRLGSFSLACTYEMEAGVPIVLPVNADIRDILALPLSYTRAQIEAAGLLPRLEDAEGRRDKAILNAAALLRPFGVRTEDVRRIVNEAIDQRMDA